jgi:hypothetical protein
MEVRGKAQPVRRLLTAGRHYGESYLLDSSHGRYVTLGAVEDDQPAGGDEFFDHELTGVLRAHGRMLEEKSLALLATGAASVSRPGVTLQARLRVSRWRRRGWLEIAAVDPGSGEVRSGSCISLGQVGRDDARLVRRITTHLAIELAHPAISR